MLTNGWDYFFLTRLILAAYEFMIHTQHRHIANRSRIDTTLEPKCKEKESKRRIMCRLPALSRSGGQNLHLFSFIPVLSLIPLFPLPPQHNTLHAVP